MMNISDFKKDDVIVIAYKHTGTFRGKVQAFYNGSNYTYMVANMLQLCCNSCAIICKWCYRNNYGEDIKDMLINKGVESQISVVEITF